jgi:hypothetical protein
LVLRFLDAERRGVQKVQEIRNALNSLNLETYPDRPAQDKKLLT